VPVGIGVGAVVWVGVGDAVGAVVCVGLAVAVALPDGVADGIGVVPGVVATPLGVGDVANTGPCGCRRTVGLEHPTIVLAVIRAASDADLDNKRKNTPNVDDIEKTTDGGRSFLRLGRTASLNDR
jgi:hypothetical protein